MIPPDRQVLSRRQVAWLAAAFADRDERGRKLGPAELQLFVIFVLLCGDVGWCQLPNRKLAPLLAVRGVPTDGAKHSAIRTARRKLEKRRLIASEQHPYDPPRRNSRTGALLVQPWWVEIIAPSVGGFRWPMAGAWISAVLRARLRPIELKAALNLAMALDGSGELRRATRADLSADLGVQRDVALAALRKLATLGLVSLREDLDERPARFSVSAIAPAIDTAEKQPITPRGPRGRLPDAIASTPEVVEFVATPTVVTAAEVEALREQLWHPRLVEEAILQASKPLKIGGRFPARTLTRDFIEPVLELQKRYPAPLVEQALTITIRERKLPGEFRRRGWNRAIDVREFWPTEG